MIPRVDGIAWEAMGRPRSPLEIFERVMKQGHDPKSNRITFDKCGCGSEKFAYSDHCIDCTHERMKALLSNPDIKRMYVR